MARKVIISIIHERRLFLLLFVEPTNGLLLARVLDFELHLGELRRVASVAPFTVHLALASAAARVGIIGGGVLWKQAH